MTKLERASRLPKRTVSELEAELAPAEERLVDTKAGATAAEQRFAAAGGLFVRLFVEEKRQRIPAAAEHWPERPASSIAIITSASPDYVSEVLKGENGRWPTWRLVHNVQIGRCSSAELGLGGLEPPRGFLLKQCHAVEWGK